MDNPDRPVGDTITVRFKKPILPSRRPDEGAVFQALASYVPENVMYHGISWTNTTLTIAIEVKADDTEFRVHPTFGVVLEAVLTALNEQCDDDALFQDDQCFMPMGKSPEFPIVINRMETHNVDARLVGAEERLSDILGFLPEPVRANFIAARWLLAKHLLPGSQTASILLVCNNMELAEGIIREGYLVLRGTRYRVERQRPDALKIRQCSHCQAVGHTLSECRAPNPKCAICAGPHEKFEHFCKKCPDADGRLCSCEDARKKCANCGGPHPAYTRSCLSAQLKKFEDRAVARAGPSK
jgi:hypothetical protein